LLFGVPIDDLTMAETLERIDQMVTLGRAQHRTFQVSTVNVDFLVNALEDVEVAAILRNADVCIPDGMPVVWGARLLGMPIAERVAGSDLVPLLVDATQTTGRHVHVFGSSPDVAERARALLLDRYPRAHLTIDPGPMIADVNHVDDEVIESIVELDPDILCVALGNPKQERFIRAHRARLGTPVMIGIGGSLDMLVGRRRRAPRWVQAIGMEWVVRAMQEPRRLGTRYARDIRVFGPAMVRAWRAASRHRTRAGLQLDLSGDTVHASICGDDVPTPEDWQAAASALAHGSSLVVDSAGLPRDEALSQTIGLVREARRFGRSVTAGRSLEGSLAADLGVRDR
jgi:N-acetylglucosaminyldiphosphoundecaprenol N-acetyl-beta-D-mannosaminyltransferase